MSVLETDYTIFGKWFEEGLKKEKDQGLDFEKITSVETETHSKTHYKFLKMFKEGKYRWIFSTLYDKQSCITK